LAKKHKKAEIRRAPTKHELSRWQRQQRLQRIITLVGVAFFAIILGFIGFGYYTDHVKPRSQPVLKVNDRTIDLDYYTKALGIYSFGSDPSSIPFFVDMTIDRLETSELVRQEAPNLGITVSDDDVKTLINKLGLPNDQVTRDVISKELLVGKAVNEHFGAAIPASCEQAKVEAMFVSSRKTAEEVASKLAASGNFTALAMQYSEEPITRQKGGNLGWLFKSYSELLLGELGKSSIEEIAFSTEPQKLSQPAYDKSVSKNVGYWVVEVLGKDAAAGGTHARGILVGTADEAMELKDKLLHGEDFATLARKYSLHETSKALDGDLGLIQEMSWYKKDTPMEALARAVPQLEPGTISEPIADSSVETPGGYWLLRVLERDNRSLDEKTKDMIKSKSFEEWLGEQKANSKIENLLDEEKKGWAIAQVRKSVEQQKEPK
jgi:parvulin-like peptidyl-prolyl isomerase